MPITLVDGNYNFDSHIQIDVGDAFRRQLVASGTTTALQQTITLYLDGVSEGIEIASGSVWQYHISVTAVDSGGDAAMFDFAGCIKNISGTTALVGDPSPNFWVADDATWSCEVVADDVGDTLQINATGDGTNDTNWSATIDLVRATT